MNIIATGHMGASIAFDGAFVTITKRGLAGVSSVNGSKMIPLSAVAAVQLKPAGRMTNGFLQLTVPGGNESTARYGRSTMAAAGDENSVIFTRKQSAEFEKFALMLQDAMRALALRA